MKKKECAFVKDKGRDDSSSLDKYSYKIGGENQITPNKYMQIILSFLTAKEGECKFGYPDLSSLA